MGVPGSAIADGKYQNVSANPLPANPLLSQSTSTSPVFYDATGRVGYLTLTVSPQDGTPPNKFPQVPYVWIGDKNSPSTVGLQDVFPAIAMVPVANSTDPVIPSMIRDSRNNPAPVRLVAPIGGTIDLAHSGLLLYLGPDITLSTNGTVSPHDFYNRQNNQWCFFTRNTARRAVFCDRRHVSWRFDVGGVAS